jgi:hydroxypyruvate reductase
MKHQEFLINLFHAAVDAADSVLALKPHIPDKPRGKTVVIGAGKGAAQLASAFETLWQEKHGDAPYEGVVVTRYGFGVPCEKIKVIEASHPVPDQNSVAGANALFQAVDGLTEDDLVIGLICGGGSALLIAPEDGLELSDKIALNEALLASGAPISAMNIIRKACSKIKGGRLAKAAYPAQVMNFIVSDVPGDSPHEVASGPTVPSDADNHSALTAIADYGIEVNEKIKAHIVRASSIPSPTDIEFQNLATKVIASNACSLEAAADYAKAQGYETVILSDAIEGEAREIAKMHGAMVREIITRNRPFKKPVVLLSGGETTVTLSNHAGKGGNNSEFMLSLAIELDGVDGFSALAADTDGIDGSESNAGAFVNGKTASKMRAAGVNPRAALKRNDSWTAFDAIDGLFSPGPTGTNVNDFRVILID